MRFTAAFGALGYKVEVPRQDWSAEKPSGVCITLWRKEMGFQNGRLWVDTRIHAQDNTGWRDKLGNRKRLKHLQRSLSEFDGFVDVVIVHGNPGEGFGDADPWLSEKRGGRWRVDDLEPATGHFRANVVPSGPGD